MNFSASFIPQFFTKQLQEILPYTDFIIGNESEAAAWASANGLPDAKDLPAIARSIALLPKSNPSRPRTVIFTQGAHQSVVVTSDDPESPKIFPVDPLADDRIMDTNGAGDAFAGGFLGSLVAGKSLDESVLAGHALARGCVQQVSTRTRLRISIKVVNRDLNRLERNTHGQRLRSSRREEDKIYWSERYRKNIRVSTGTLLDVLHFYLDNLYIPFIRIQFLSPRLFPFPKDFLSCNL